MTHVYHEALPDYVPDAVLHSGCPECEARARVFAITIDACDRERFERLWRRAAAVYANGCYTPGAYPPEGAVLLDPLEVPLLGPVQAVQRALQREVRGCLGRIPEWVAETRPEATSR